MTLEELAEKSGVSRVTLWKAEKSPTQLSDKTAAAVAPFLGVKPKELFRMSLPTIEITDAVRWVRGNAKQFSPGPDRERLLQALGWSDRVAASMGVLGGVSQPEDPGVVGRLLAVVLGSPRQQVAPGVWLATTPKGRQYVVWEYRGEGGETKKPEALVVLHEMEYRLGRGEVEIAVYARPPDVIQ